MKSWENRLCSSGKLRPVYVLLASNDTVPIVMWRGGGVHSGECRLVLIADRLDVSTWAVWEPARQRLGHAWWYSVRRYSMLCRHQPLPGRFRHSSRQSIPYSALLKPATHGQHWRPTNTISRRHYRPSMLTRVGSRVPTLSAVKPVEFWRKRCETLLACAFFSVGLAVAWHRTFT